MIRINHRGHPLTDEQLEAATPVIQRQLAFGFKSLREFVTALDEALNAAGCPVPPEPEKAKT